MLYQRWHYAYKRFNFILKVIWIDIHCHLEVTVAQQGHFGSKSTAARNGKKDTAIPPQLL